MGMPDSVNSLKSESSHADPRQPYACVLQVDLLLLHFYFRPVLLMGGKHHPEPGDVRLQTSFQGLSSQSRSLNICKPVSFTLNLHVSSLRCLIILRLSAWSYQSLVSCVRPRRRRVFFFTSVPNFGLRPSLYILVEIDLHSSYGVLVGTSCSPQITSVSIKFQARIFRT